MGLLIWLPLHGNLTNYGSSPVTFSLVTTGGGVAAATSGGKTDLSCYQRTTVNTVSHITSSAGVTLDKDFTMACWCCPTTAGAETSANGILTNHNHSDCSGAGITLKYVSATDCRISCNTGNGSNRTYMDYYGTTNIYGAWHHLCLTYQKATQKYRLYVDGVCEREVTYGNSAKANKFNIFDWSTGHSSNGSYRPLCKINDVRVYDHCLSKREVKLLSQGLVAHYKLSAGNANNLLTNTSYPTTSTGLVYGPSSIVYDNDLDANVFERATTATSESYVGSIRTAAVEPNTQYTFSCDIKVDSMVKSVDFFWLSDTTDNIKTGTGYVDVTTTSGHTFTPDIWNHFTWTFTTKSNVNTGYIRIDNNGTKTSGTTAALRVTNLKLEKGSKDTGYSLSPSETGFSVADDSSGYCRNGTAFGTFQFDSSSPRYNTCAIFDGSTNKIELSIKKLMQALLKDKCTINFWVNETNTGSRSVYFGGYNGSNFNIEMESAKFRVYWNGSPDLYCDANTVSNNVWAMFTIVVDVQTGIKVYKNGSLIKSHNAALTDITSGFTNETFRIGADSRTGATMAECKMSDFRIYCSALSATDILELYRNAGSVTKDGGLIAYEFQEATNNAKMKKNGVFIAEDFSERGPLGDMKIQVLSDNSVWARVFYHKNTGGTVLFESAAEAKSASTANKYSCLHMLDSLKGADGKYEFLLAFPTDFPGKYNRWKQNNNPCNEFITNGDGSATAAGYTAVSITWTGNYWGGLTRQNSNADTKSECYLSGSTGHSNWFYAIGAYEKWDAAMPGPNSTPVSETELWVRVDTLPSNSQFSILKEQFVQSSLLHEI